MNFKTSILLFFVLCAGCRVMQPAKKVTELSIEKDLLYHYKRIGYWNENHNFSDTINSSDSMLREISLVQEKLMYYTSNYPYTLTYKFDSLLHMYNWGIKVVSSDDKKFRIYSWDTQTGGTMLFYASMAQYKTGNKVKSVILVSAYYNHEIGPGPRFNDIYTFKTNNTKYYVVISDVRFGTGMYGNFINLYTIKGDSLLSANLIKTDSGMQAMLYNETDNTRGINRTTPSLYYVPKNNTINVPQMTNDSTYTGRVITYKFTGKYFEVVKTP